MFEFQCPYCGGVKAVADEESVSKIDRILCLLSFGFYDPWEKAYQSSVKKFLTGNGYATCMICGHRYKSTDIVDKDMVIKKEERDEAEKSLAMYLELEKNKSDFYPRY